MKGSESRALWGRSVFLPGAEQAGDEEAVIWVGAVLLHQRKPSLPSDLGGSCRVLWKEGRQAKLWSFLIQSLFRELWPWDCCSLLPQEKEAFSFISKILVSYTGSNNTKPHNAGTVLLFPRVQALFSVFVFNFCTFFPLNPSATYQISPWMAHFWAWFLHFLCTGFSCRLCEVLFVRMKCRRARWFGQSPVT